MKTSTIGNIITGAIAGVSIGLCVAFPTPLAIFPIIAVGTSSAVATQVLTMKSRNQREYESSIDKELLKVENNQSAIYTPQQQYQKLHSNSHQATFRGDNKRKIDYISESKKDNDLTL